MKVSLKWLSEYVDVPADTKAFCDRLDLTGTGVEAVERTGAALDGVVVGHVLTCEQHPDSDHMHVVTVDVGAGEPVQIVTKTFMDVFASIGGAGALLSLLAAILLFGRRRSARRLSAFAAVPMCFNISEIMLFGLPVVWNPALFVPFEDSVG